MNKNFKKSVRRKSIRRKSIRRKSIRKKSSRRKSVRRKSIRRKSKKLNGGMFAKLSKSVKSFFEDEDCVKRRIPKLNEYMIKYAGISHDRYFSPENFAKIWCEKYYKESLTDKLFNKIFTDSVNQKEIDAELLMDAGLEEDRELTGDEEGWVSLEPNVVKKKGRKK